MKFNIWFFIALLATGYSQVTTIVSYTGSSATYVVPSDVNSLLIDAFGANGGGYGANYGLGGRVQSLISVTPGQTLYLLVGGAGSDSASAITTGGWNGGGNGCRSGGGATDVRTSLTDISSRIVVAGGGGGTAWQVSSTFIYGQGGNGGGSTGGSGGQSSGGSQEEGGTCTDCSAGTLGSGGASGEVGGNYYPAGGGGGGGYYGGAGYAPAIVVGGLRSGGGGSNYCSSTVCTKVLQNMQGAGTSDGNGRIIITTISSTANLPSCSSSVKTIASSAAYLCAYYACPGSLAEIQNCPGKASTACGGTGTLSLQLMLENFDSGVSSTSCPSNSKCAYLSFPLTEACQKYTVMQICSGGNCVAGVAISTSLFTSQPSAIPTPEPTYMQTPNNMLFYAGYTGSYTTFTVPDGVYLIKVDAYGARGGMYSVTWLSGLGGYMQALVKVTPGQVFYAYVGGVGALPTGGWNGGGTGYSNLGGGGGATDLRTIIDDDSSRILVAGGGGGGGWLGYGRGNGGGLLGASSFTYTSGQEAIGGSQSSGGYCQSCSGSSGYFGVGGDSSGGGGGGGGYYGGSGGGDGGGGGGGSSYCDSTLCTILQDVQGSEYDVSGAAQLFISLAPVPSSIPTPSPTAIPSAGPTNPTSWPSPVPTPEPSAPPSSPPSTIPTPSPTALPTAGPTNPSAVPTMLPSSLPTGQPTGAPTRQPLSQPTARPSGQPSHQPTSRPSYLLEAIASFNTTQSLICPDISCIAKFMDPTDAFQISFKNTVIAQVPGLLASGIKILSVGPARRMLAEDKRLLAAIPVKINYNTAFTVNTLYKATGTTTPNAAAAKVISSLGASVTSGAFSTSLSASIPGVVAPNVAPVFSSVTTTITHSAKPTGTPTSAPSQVNCPAGYRHESNSPKCILCPEGSAAPYDSMSCSVCRVGSYAVTPADSCTLCALGWFNTVKSSNSCTACIYPSYNIELGSNNCDAFCLCLNSTQLGIVATGLCLFFIMGTVISGEKALSLITFTIMPALDTVSNSLYMLQTNFYSPLLFALVVLFHFLPDTVLIYRMREYGALIPGYYIPQPRFLTDGSLWWLGGEGGFPTYFGKKMSCTFERHDTLMKILSFWVVWIVSIGAQIGCIFLYVFRHTPYILIHLPFWGVWMLIGCYCYQIKAMAIGKIWLGWFRVWLNSNKMDSDVAIDTDIMNQSIFVHFVLETFPQLILQSLNNQLTGSWSGLAIFSTVLSIFMVANGCYRYLYYTLFLRVKFADIPLELTLLFTTIKLENARHVYGDKKPERKGDAEDGDIGMTWIDGDEHHDPEQLSLTNIYSVVEKEEVGMDNYLNVSDTIPPPRRACRAPIVSPVTVVQGEELQSLLGSLDNRMSLVESELKDTNTNFSSRLVFLETELANLKAGASRL